jgi:hypothetical protein
MKTRIVLLTTLLLLSGIFDHTIARQWTRYGTEGYQPL